MKKQFAPGMRVVIRDEEWLIKRIVTNDYGMDALYCTGISPLVKDKDAMFLPSIDNRKDSIEIVDPAKVTLVADQSPYYRRTQLFLESQWRQQTPTAAKLHFGYKAAIPFHDNTSLESNKNDITVRFSTKKELIR